MIAELLLIVDLLNKPSFRSMDYTPVKQVTPQITKIVQPIAIPDLTSQEIATAYLEASTGRPETMKKRMLKVL